MRQRASSISQRPTAVVLNPKPAVLETLRKSLGELGFNVVGAPRGEEPLFLALLEESVDLVVVDGDSATPAELLRLCESSATIPKLVVFSTRGTTSAALRESIVWEAFEHVSVIDKPIDEASIQKAVSSAFPTASSLGLRLDPIDSDTENLNLTYDLDDASIIDIVAQASIVDISAQAFDTVVSEITDPTSVRTDLDEIVELSEPLIVREIADSMLREPPRPIVEVFDPEEPPARSPITAEQIVPNQREPEPPVAEISPLARRLAARIRGLAEGDPGTGEKLEQQCERALQDEWIFSRETLHASSVGEPVLSGRIEALPVEALLRRAEQLPGANLCRFRSGDTLVDIYFEDRRIVFARHHGASRSLRLGRFLVDAEVVEQDVLSDIVQMLSPHQLLGEALLAYDLVGPSDLVLALTRQVEELTDLVLGWSDGSFSLELGVPPPPKACVEVAPGVVIERRYRRLGHSFPAPARSTLDEPTRRFSTRKLDN